MDDVFRALEDRQSFIGRADVLALGLDDRFIRHQLRHGAWQRVRAGAYCSSAVWSGLDSLEKHRVTARAVVRSLGDGVVLSHQTGMLFHPRCDVWGVDLSKVHVTRRDSGTGGIEAGVAQHAGTCRDEDIDEMDGLLVMKAPRAVIETSLVSPVETGLVVADSALHHHLVSEDQLAEALAKTSGWKGRRKADLVVRMADGRAESVGESRSRYLWWSQGLPRPDLQYEVYDEFGTLIAIVDFAWPAHRLFGEFDGRAKYGRELNDDQDPGEVVFREKKREDKLRRLTGFAMFRLTWADLYQPTVTANRARRLMADVA